MDLNVKIVWLIFLGLATIVNAFKFRKWILSGIVISEANGRLRRKKKQKEKLIEEEYANCDFNVCNKKLGIKKTEFSKIECSEEQQESNCEPAKLWLEQNRNL